MNLKITSITLLCYKMGSDVIYLHTELKDAAWPYEDTLSIKFIATKGSGKAYCEKNFPGVKIKVVE